MSMCMLFRRLLTMVHRLMSMSLGNVRVMTRSFMLARLDMLSCLNMMFGR